MHKIIQNNKKISDPFHKIIILIIILLFSFKTNMAFAINNNWIEVSKTPLGIQYLDSDSLINKDKGIIEIKTKYLNIDSKDSEKIVENIYLMEINCLTNKYKDISVNGKNNLNAKWEDPNKDKLINDVITFSCKNV
tara:strand:- start:1460 stop:1867 length:408 start_codon:yes stop_codon:yes gene_type:complete